MFLEGISVAEIGDGLAGKSTGHILRTFGADVTQVSTREIAQGAGSTRGLFEMTLDVGKSWERADNLASFLVDHRYDVTICDRIQRPIPGLPIDVEQYVELVRNLNRGVWITISAYGLSGPSRSQEASELTLLAAGGQLAYVLTDDGTQVPFPHFHGMQSVAQIAALAACHGIDRKRSRACPVHLDVSAQEALIASGPVLPCAYFLLHCGEEKSGPRRLAAPYGMYPCVDGDISITVLEDHQWQAAAKAMNLPDRFKELAGDDRLARTAEINDVVRNWTTPRGKHDCELILQDFGVPCAAVNTAEEVLTSPQFQVRGCCSEASVEGGHAIVEVESMSQIWSPAARQSQHTQTEDRAKNEIPRGLTSLRVLELGHVLAVPYAGALLGAMGASVVKVEDRSRTDTYRRTGPFIDGHRDPEWSAYFAQFNHSKDEVCVDTENDARQLAELLDWADVVIENWGPKRAQRLGVDFDAISARDSSKLAISVSGFGHTGPLSRYRAYAYDIAAYCGLVHAMTREADGNAVDIGFPLADLLTSFAVATLVAAWSVGFASGTKASESGVGVDLSMAEVLADRMNLYFVHSQMAAAQTEVLVGRTDLILSNLAGTAVAISVFSPEEQGALIDILRPLGACLAVPTDDGGTASSLQYGTKSNVLKRAILPTFNDKQLQQITTELQSAGIRASILLNARALIADPHLRARGFFSEVQHPAWGSRKLIGLPWRIANDDPFPLGAPPALRETPASFGDR